MLRNIALGSLSFTLLPFGIAFSATVLALLLPFFALSFPIIALGSAIKVGGTLANLLFDAILGRQNYYRGDNRFFNTQTISLIVTQFLFIVLAYIPTAVIVAVLAVVVAPLLFISLSACTSYYMSKSIVDFIMSFANREYTLSDPDSEEIEMSSFSSEDDTNEFSHLYQQSWSRPLHFFSYSFNSDNEPLVEMSTRASLSLGNSDSD